jgi:hypothetical protein
MCKQCKKSETTMVTLCEHCLTLMQQVLGYKETVVTAQVYCEIHILVRMELQMVFTRPATQVA